MAGTNTDSGQGAPLNNTLAHCLDALFAGAPLPARRTRGVEVEADAAFAAGEFERAIAGYAQVAHVRRAQAKRGWCLAWQGRVKEARGRLTPHNAGTHPVALAYAALVVAGGLYPMTVSATDRATMAKLMHAALSAPDPGEWVFLLYAPLARHFDAPEDRLRVLRRGQACHPQPGLLTAVAMLERELGEPTRETAAALVDATEAGASGMECAGDALDHAIALQRADLVDRVLAVIKAEIESDDDRRVFQVLSLWARLRIPDEAPAAAHAAACALAAEFDRVDMWKEDEELAGAALMLQLLAAVRLGELDAVHRALWGVIEVVWAGRYAAGAQYSASVMIGRSSACLDFSDLFAEGAVPSVPDRLLEAWAQLIVINDHRRSWWRRAPEDIARADAALLVVCGEDPPPGCADLLVEAAVRRGWPDQVGRLLARAWDREDEPAMPAPPDLAGWSAGDYRACVEALLAELGTPAAEARPVVARGVVALARLLSGAKHVALAQHLLDTVAGTGVASDALDFQRALMRQEQGHDQPAAEALYQGLLEREIDHPAAAWNLSLLLKVRGAVVELEQLLECCTHRAAQSDADVEWPQTLDVVRASLEHARKVQVEARLPEDARARLASLPSPRAGLIGVDELQLVQAVALIALNRACDLEPATWVLRPYARGQIPFEPDATDGFGDAVLTSLVLDGFLGVDPRTPLDAWYRWPIPGGLQLRAPQVTWTLPPATLELVRTLRELPHAAWPGAWRDALPDLWRELAVGECQAYLEDQCQRRGIDPPPAATMRPLLRAWLHTHTQSQVWYYLTAAATGAADYRAKYRAPRQQVTTRVLNLAVDREARARTEGWTNGYRRFGFPRSHMVAALHDVLTRYGEGAFERPIDRLGPESP